MYKFNSCRSERFVFMLTVIHQRGAGLFIFLCLTDLHPLTSSLRHSDTNFKFNQHSLEDIIVISSLRIITKCLWSHTVKLKPTLTICYQ